MSQQATELPLSLLISLWQTMVRIRLFEEKISEFNDRKLVRGSTHRYIGEEAIAAGVCAALQPADYVLSTHRGHGHCIARGADLGRMFAELLGRQEGYCQGKGGSMHIADFERGVLGANGIVGANLPIANGVALAARMEGRGRIVVSFFGDGASNQGAFHEALNLAGIWKLPVLFICENNQYGVSLHVSSSTAGNNIVSRASAYGFSGRLVDGNDPTEVYLATLEVAEQVRAGEGPVLLECLTYRLDGHYCGDPERYRDKDEVKRAWLDEPIERMRSHLIGERLLHERQLDLLYQEVTEQIDAAAEWALACQPASSMLAVSDVYSGRPGPFTVSKEQPDTPKGQATELTYAAAIRAAMENEMAINPQVFLIGLDVGKRGGAFGVSYGMLERFGAERVLDTPISEAAVIGAAVGSAMAGQRPIAEIMFSDFVTVAMDQVANQAAKLHYMTGGKAKLPLVIRLPGGGGTGNAAQHSQSLEAWFAHLPGLKVVAPSCPQDAYGLLRASIREDDPIVFIEHRAIYQQRGPVFLESEPIPLGIACIRREGTDVTLATYSGVVGKAMSVANRLASEGISVEVLDLRTLCPLDLDSLFASVRKTGRLVVAHEAVCFGGFSGEIAGQVAEHCFEALRSPIIRIGAAYAPVPYALTLETAVLPQEADLEEAIRRFFKGVDNPTSRGRLGD